MGITSKAALLQSHLVEGAASYAANAEDLEITSK